MMTNSLHKVRDPDDLQIQHKCHDCCIRGNQFFCDLSQPDLKELELVKITKVFPRHTTLFLEGQPADGVYMLCQGRVKLSTCSQDGRIIIIGVAGPGEVLGLSAAMAGVEYEVTAEVIEISQVNFVPREEFLRYIEHHPAACLGVARQLGRNYYAAHQKLCAFGMSEPVFVKLAKLILGWSTDVQSSNGNGAVRMTNSFTHEEIAEMIGTSRETVTRALREMRERGLVTLKGSDLVIHNRQLLSSTAGKPLTARYQV
jgi:CRP/FNR family transcriptional regulator, cyclic AMP receptor protein